ncbi:hypothetical protein HK102_007394 [Quaeritorhiza haematococci]|nr:hypothetical protein HK102_007394 [Quaeritorhiza haematococci]
MVTVTKSESVKFASASHMEFGSGTEIPPVPGSPTIPRDTTKPKDKSRYLVITIRIPFFAVLLLFILVSNITVGMVTYHLTRQSGQQTSQMLITMLQEKYVDFVDNVLMNRLNHTEVTAIEIRELWEDGAFIRRPWQKEELTTMFSILKAQTLFVSSMHFTTLDGNLFGWGALGSSPATNATSSDPDIIISTAFTLWKMDANIYYEEQYDIDGNLLASFEPFEYDATPDPWVHVLVENNARRQWTRPYGQYITHATRAINSTTNETIVYTGADLSIPFIGRTLKQYTQNETGYEVQIYVIDITDKFILGSSDTSFQSLILDEYEWPIRPVYLDEIAQNNTFVHLINSTLTIKPALWESDEVTTLQHNLAQRSLFLTFKRIQLDPQNTWLLVQVADGTDIISLVDSNFKSAVITLCVVLATISITGFFFSMSISKTLATLIGDLKKLAKFEFADVEYLKTDRRRFHFIGEIAMIQQEFLAAVREFAKHLQAKRGMVASPATPIQTKGYGYVQGGLEGTGVSSGNEEEARRESKSASFHH